MKVTDLKEYEFNAKLHPREHVDQIVASIEEFGFNDPIAVDENNVIIEGHGRLKAAIEMGLEEVPVIQLVHMTEEQKKAYTIAHNKLTMNTGFDLSTLYKELESLEGDMQELVGFTDEEINEIFDSLTVDKTPRKEREIYELPDRDIKEGDIFCFR